MNATGLRRKILKSLRDQGFVIDRGNIELPRDLSKDQIRSLHTAAVKHKRDQAKDALLRFESRLLANFADGFSIDPMRIQPELVEVQPNTENERLFRYATLQWSIPVSKGYGRRLRFLVFDKQNGKLIGVIGLGDPVYSLGCRDDWIGWSKENKRRYLRHVMDAFVLGAVQPYSQLLCGKLVAMLATSTEVRQSFEKKYGGSISLISKTKGDASLALITTLSALGRSSIYNRLSFQNTRLFHALGFTNGSGDFHFTNGTYQSIFEYATENCRWSAKNPLWGTGSRNRREVVRKCLQNLGLKEDLLYHGVRRQVFAVPLASNTREFLRGEDSRLAKFAFTAEELSAKFRERWLSTRLDQRRSYASFDKLTLALWYQNPDQQNSYAERLSGS